MEHEQQTQLAEWPWKDVPDRQRWIAAWGVLWRIWVFSLGVYGAILAVMLMVVLAVALFSN